ncbi:uncharacterized protein LOC108150454 [Drosophila elegans]|uniref:uncharacterized protein LOC108150454 n=1 Tax=Drosophila elegans TaxID=30023 RepID=UPI0007E6EDDA|nr:uncharacterized protein LOC108150454 [Drosophila elegans]
MSSHHKNCALVAQFPWKSKMVSFCDRKPSRSRCLSHGQCLWLQRNQLEIQQLAKLVGSHPEDIDGFLFELSLQNYNRQLNPKGCGWNACNVPLCYPYICDRYMSIFDHRGNLRSPSQSNSLRRILPLLLDYLNGNSPEAQKDSPIYKACPDGHRANRHPKVLSYDSESNDEESLNPIDWSLGPSNSSRVPMKRKRSITRHESQILEPQSEPESEKDLNRKKKPKTFGRQSVFLNDELALAYGKPIAYAEYLMKGLGRHRTRGSYTGPVGDLRTKRIRILIRQLVQRKGSNITFDDLRYALKNVDLEWKRTAEKDLRRQVRTAKAISNLYYEIVQQKSKQPIPPALGTVRGNYPKVPSASKVPRRYLGEQVPVLFYEPYDPRKNWTGQRRHTKKIRLNSKNDFSTLKTKRHVHTSLKKKIKALKDKCTISAKRQSGKRVSPKKKKI